MVGEHAPEAPIAEESTPESAHFRRRFHPARRLQVELPQRLQETIVLLGQQACAPQSRERCRIPSRLVAPATLKRLSVVAQASAPKRAFRGTIEEQHFARRFVARDRIGFSPAFLHRRKRAQSFGIRKKTGFDILPCKPCMSLEMPSEAFAERRYDSFSDAMANPLS